MSCSTKHKKHLRKACKAGNIKSNIDNVQINIDNISVHNNFNNVKLPNVNDDVNNFSVYNKPVENDKAIYYKKTSRSSKKILSRTYLS